MQFSIKNRIGLDIVGDALIPEKSIGLAFVLHGLGGFRAQNHIKAIVQTLFKNNYTVVDFDATNSIGDSGGRYEDATMQKHYEDLCDVISWAKNQNWYKEPFVLIGHSLGGYAVAKYSEEYPDLIKGVFPHATVVSGELSFDASRKFKPQELKDWEETGWTNRTSSSKPGTEMKLPWSHMQERLLHDLKPKAGNLTMPVLIVVGQEDSSCPPDHQKVLYDLVPGKKEFHIIKDGPHTFKLPEHIKELQSILEKWIISI